MTPTLPRRDLIRAALLGGTGLLALSACADSGGDRSSDPQQEPTVTTAPTPGRTLLVYFSRPGENYWYGGRRTLTVGNTEVLASMIADRIDCDVHRINAADPYSDNYDDTVARNVREQDQDARPRIAGPLPDVTPYATVILASPIWNVRPPMIMSTFAEAVPLAGKRLLPVTTHAMSGLGRAPDVYAELAPRATIDEGLAVQGEEVQAAAPTLDTWLRRVLPR